ncbi:hypothetical protein VTP01DRAFT_7831 [Rhizomucor pusillus]|uniref:uncharacterized protein n=1 Tax=Rhizomucor pusillus TaxID=4840 RepID=UPI0037423BB3
MEQELIELLLVAKKALSTGQAICAQANERTQETEQYTEAIVKAWPKILFLHNHILIQLSTLERIREFLTVKAEEVHNCITDLEESLAKTSIELQTIFDNLKSCKIDEDILRVNQEIDASSTSKKLSTLFDYIDDKAVFELQKQADDEIGEIENLYASLTTTSKSLSSTITELAALQEAATSISLGDSSVALTNDKTHVQEEEISKMAEILTALTNHYDQLGEATRLCQTDPDAEDSLDIRILQGDNTRIPDILDDLQDSLEVVETICDEARVRMQVFNSIQDELFKVLLQLDFFSAPGGQADAICEKITSAEAEMKEREARLNSYCKELRSLAEWYNAYASSYSHLILEIERRRKSKEKRDKLYEELVTSLENAYNDEYQERHSWFTQHGAYLPEDMCRFMMEPPPRIVVHMEEQENHRLPNLSKATIEKALANIHGNNEHTC